MRTLLHELIGIILVHQMAPIWLFTQKSWKLNHGESKIGFDQKSAIYLLQYIWSVIIWYAVHDFPFSFFSSFLWLSSSSSFRSCPCRWDSVSPLSYTTEWPYLSMGRNIPRNKPTKGSPWFKTNAWLKWRPILTQNCSWIFGNALNCVFRSQSSTT